MAGGAASPTATPVLTVTHRAFRTGCEACERSARPGRRPHASAALGRCSSLTWFCLCPGCPPSPCSSPRPPLPGLANCPSTLKSHSRLPSRGSWRASPAPPQPGSGAPPCPHSSHVAPVTLYHHCSLAGLTDTVAEDRCRGPPTSTHTSLCGPLKLGCAVKA